MNFIFIGLVVSLVFAGVTFIASQSFYSSLFIFLVTNVFFVVLVRRRINKSQEKIHRYHQCYQFINSFIITLNVKHSLSAAIESSYETMDEITKEIIDSIKELNEEEKLLYLVKYFKFDIYRLFTDTIILWNEEGGDILRMSQYLINQARLKEEYLLNCELVHRNKTIEFVVLWAIALAILATLRFALSQFFSMIIKTSFYQIAVVIIVLFIIASIYILVNRITDINVEGWKDDEK